MAALAILGAIVALVLSLVLSPCPLIGLNQAQWELEAGVIDETTTDDGRTELEVEFALNGHASEVAIEDVRIVFLNDDTAVRVVDVGTVSGYTFENRTVRLNEPPDRIELRTGSIETNEDAEYAIEGLRRVDTGQYEQITIEKRSC